MATIIELLRLKEVGQQEGRRGEVGASVAESREEREELEFSLRLEFTRALALVSESEHINTYLLNEIFRGESIYTIKERTN